MGFLKNIIRNAVSDGISKGIGDAVRGAVNSAVKPAADEFAKNAANEINKANQSLEENKENIENIEKELNQGISDADALNFVWDKALSEFPKWPGKIEDVSTDEGDGYSSISIKVNPSSEMANAYLATLKAAGFSGDEQIMKKTVNGLTYNVDFTFICDCEEIRYLITK